MCRLIGPKCTHTKHSLQENVLILDAPEVAVKYSQQFERLWQRYA
jgi:hypothetical protein